MARPVLPKGKVPRATQAEQNAAEVIRNASRGPYGRARRRAPSRSGRRPSTGCRRRGDGRSGLSVAVVPEVTVRNVPLPECSWMPVPFGMNQLNQLNRPNRLDQVNRWGSLVLTGGRPVRLRLARLYHMRESAEPHRGLAHAAHDRRRCPGSPARAFVLTGWDAVGTLRPCAWGVPGLLCVSINRMRAGSATAIHAFPCLRGAPPDPTHPTAWVGKVPG